MAKILLVDDAEDILFVLEQSFQKAGHKVVSTSDPRRVMPLSRSGRFDAVVLDVMMPRITGWNLLDELRAQEETRSTPVVMLTALSSVADRVRGLRGGADDYMTKPFEPAELIARVERLIDRRTASAAALQGRLDGHSVEDVLQQLAQGRKTGRLEFHSPDGGGSMIMTHGEIVWADHGELEGEEAVLSLLSLESGTFGFHSGVTNVATEAQSSLRLAPLLLDWAWIDDELAKRQSLLPSNSVLLSLDRLPTSPPDDLPSLPLRQLGAVLTRPGGSTLKELVQSCRCAPKRALLAVAWLAEQGLLRQDQSASTVEASARSSSETQEHLENFDVAVREFLQAGLHRGVRLDRICLQGYFAPGAWQSGLKLLASIPGTLLEPPTGDSPAPFEGPLRHPAGTIDIRWTPLPITTSERVPDPPEGCAGIVVGLDRDWPADDLDALGAHLAGRAPKAGCVLLAPHSLGDLGLVGLSVDPQWRTPVCAPETFEQLLLELTQADPQADAEN